jgi:hypothetical protein
VGLEGIARLWDTESHQPLGQPFSQKGRIIERVSFSRDGRYLAYGGCEGKLTLWVVKDIVPELPVRAFIHTLQRNKLLTAEKSTSVTGTVLSRGQYYCTLEFDRLLTKLSQIDATIPCAQSGSDDYGDFFQVSFLYRHAKGTRASVDGKHSKPRDPSAPSGPFSRSKVLGPSSARRLWNFLFPSPASESIALQPRTKRSLFARHTGPQPVAVAAGRKKQVGSVLDVPCPTTYITESTEDLCSTSPCKSYRSD